MRGLRGLRGVRPRSACRLARGLAGLAASTAKLGTRRGDRRGPRECKHSQQHEVGSDYEDSEYCELFALDQNSAVIVGGPVTTASADTR